jgi:hypothetical protein
MCKKWKCTKNIYMWSSNFAKVSYRQVKWGWKAKENILNSMNNADGSLFFSDLYLNSIILLSLKIK